jgi:hypothetical protein
MQVRAAIVRRAVAAANDAQCPAGGWDKWQQETAGYRAALKAKVEAIRPNADWYLSRSKDPVDYNIRFGFLEGIGCREAGAKKTAPYLYDERFFDALRSQRPIQAASRWLRARGVDLIVVPVPLQPEVYSEHFLDPCPVDGIIAPHVRKTLLELLTADVEVIDAWRILREGRSSRLYRLADNHWTPGAGRLVAIEVARRIGRYGFGKAAKESVAIATGSLRTEPEDQTGWKALSEAQLQAAERAARDWPVATAIDGSNLQDDPDGPVLLIGDSFAMTGDFGPQLVLASNLQIRRDCSCAQMAQAFADFLREPESLRGVRVVVWVMEASNLAGCVTMPAALVD